MWGSDPLKSKWECLKLYFNIIINKLFYLYKQNIIKYINVKTIIKYDFKYRDNNSNKKKYYEIINYNL